MTNEKFVEELARYIGSKFPEADIHTVMEAAEFCAMKASNWALDLVIERDKAWERTLKDRATRK